MTTPRLSKQVKGLGRHYTSPLSGVDGPSVTNVIGIVDKPAIAWWQTKGALRAAWEDREAFSRMGDVETAVKAYQSAAFAQRNKAADVGSDVHAVCEALAGDTDLPSHSADARPYVDQFLKAVSSLDISPVEVERSVWNETWAYGGTFDLYANLSGVPTLVDLKTGKGVYDEAAWQLAGLNACEVYADDGAPFRPAERLAVLHLTPDSWSLHGVADPSLALTTFLGLRQAWAGIRNGSALEVVP